MTEIILNPIFETPEDYERLEEEITRYFREVVYEPLLSAIGAPARLENALTGKLVLGAMVSDMEYLAHAIQSGQIRFHRGQFKGAFSARVSRTLKALGAKWDRKQGSFAVPQNELPLELQQVIAVSESRFQRVAEKLTEKLNDIQRSIRPVDETELMFDMAKLFDRSIFKVDTNIQKTLKNLTIQPTLSGPARARIAAEYSKSLMLPIQSFTKHETLELRQRIMEKAYSGHRYEAIVSEIQASYGVSQRKAKFLARQETNLLMAKFKQVRYQEAGSDEYIWGCVAGSANHPVRHFHRLNEGKRFRWSVGAPINERGERKNPGQDYNCRCFARPIVKFQ